MDIGLNEEQELLRKAARGFLEKECPEEHVRAMEADDKGYSPQLWRKIAELGWHGLMIAPQFGGSGLSFYDLCIVVEEAGRALLPGPFLPNHAVSHWLQQWAWKNLVRQFRSCIPCQQGNSADSQLPRIGVLAELLGLVRQLAGIRMGREHRAVLRGAIHKFRKSGNCRRGRPSRDVT